MDKQLSDCIEKILPEVTAFRRELHAHPELSFKEYETSKRIRNRLAGLPALKVLPPLIETDVVAILNPDKAGPCIALRADIDALPIEEETGVAHQSTSPGVMHACGHDGHTATLLGAALALSRVADRVPGKVKFIFQPAEEDGAGGCVLCQRGVLESPKVDAAIALHAWPFEPVGNIAIRTGWAMAASSPFTITVQGQGSHGAYPHRSIDPIVTSAHIITALQTIVSRTVDPQDPVVVTIGQILAGTAENIIPPKATMLGTMRYTRTELGPQLRERLSRIVEHTAQAHGATATVNFIEGYPPMFNDETLSELIVQTGRDLFGPEHAVTKLAVSMGVEDFAYYAQKVPAAMFRLGVREPSSDTCPALHHPGFDFHDGALEVGIRMFCELTMRYLAGGGR